MADQKVGYFKSQTYRDKNWAPDQINVASVIALANAAKMARDKNLLDIGVVEKMLPNLMVEGRANDYGVNSVELSAKSTTPKSLNIDSFFFHPNTTSKEGYIVPDKTKLLAMPRGMPQDQIDQDLNARLVIAALTQKQEVATRLAEKQGRTATADDVIQLWNGTGPDSERHLNRVREADRMLKTDPGNKKIKELWDNILGVLPTIPVLDSQSANTGSAVLATMINNFDDSK